MLDYERVTAPLSLIRTGSGEAIQLCTVWAHGSSYTLARRKARYGLYDDLLR